MTVESIGFGPFKGPDYGAPSPEAVRSINGAISTYGSALPTTTGRRAGDLHFHTTELREYVLIPVASVLTWTMLGGADFSSTVGAGLPTSAGRAIGDIHYNETDETEYVLLALSGGSVEFADNFNRADGAPGADYTLTGTVSIVSNALVVSSFGEGLESALHQFAHDTLNGEAVVSVPAGGYLDLILGADSSGNLPVNHIVARIDRSVGGFEAFKVIRNGNQVSSTSLAAANLDQQLYVSLEVSVSGGSISIEANLWNAAQTVQLADPASTITGGSNPGTWQGFRAQNTAAEVDSWRVWAVSADPVWAPVWPGGASAVAAADVSYAGSAGLAATNVEAALDELDTEKAAVGHDHDGAYSALGHTHPADDNQTASEVAFTPYLTLAATNVQDAIQELLDEAGGGAVAAADVSYAGSTNLAATDVEAALDELDTEKVAKASFAAKGDVLVGTAAGVLAAVPVGTTGYVFTADPTTASGVAWKVAGADTTALHYKGAWAATTYAVNDAVTNAYALYVALSAVGSTAGAPSTNPINVTPAVTFGAIDNGTGGGSVLGGYNQYYSFTTGAVVNTTVDRIYFNTVTGGSGTARVGIASAVASPSSITWVGATPAAMTLPSAAAQQTAVLPAAITLAPNTTYYLVFQGVSGQGAYSVGISNAALTPSGSIASGVNTAFYAANGAGSWSSFANYHCPFKLELSMQSSPYWAKVADIGPKSTVGAGLPAFEGRTAGDLHFNTTDLRQYVMQGTLAYTAEDTFTRADGAIGSTEVGAKVWQASAGVAVASNKASVGANRYLGIDLGAALAAGIPLEVQADVTDTTTFRVVIEATTQGSATVGYFVEINTATGACTMYRNLASVATVTSSLALAAAMPYRCLLSHNGSGQLSFSINGTVLLTYTDTSPLRGRYTYFDGRTSSTLTVDNYRLFAPVSGAPTWVVTQPIDTLASLGYVAPSLASLGGTKSTVAAGMVSLGARSTGDLHYNTVEGRQYEVTGAPGASGVDDWVRGSPTSSPGSLTIGGSAYAYTTVGSVWIADGYIRENSGSGRANVYVTIAGSGAEAMTATMDVRNGANSPWVFVRNPAANFANFAYGYVAMVDTQGSSTQFTPRLYRDGAAVASGSLLTGFGDISNIRAVISVTANVGTNCTVTAEFRRVDTGAILSTLTYNDTAALTGTSVGISMAASGQVERFTVERASTAVWTATQAHYLTDRIPGVVAVTNNIAPPGMRVPVSTTARTAQIRLGTGPTGADMIVLFQRYNGGVFQSTIATVTIPAGTGNASVTGLSVALASGDIVQLDVTQVGSGTAGADIRASLDCW